jgi:hypothetical protein
VVLYGCETWSLTLREENTLKMFENRMLRRIVGSKTDKVMGGWRKLHNEELHNLCSPPNMIRMVKLRRMRCEWHVARMWAKHNAHRILVGKQQGKRSVQKRKT